MYRKKCCNTKTNTINLTNKQTDAALDWESYKFGNSKVKENMVPLKVYNTFLWILSCNINFNNGNRTDFSLFQILKRSR